VRERRGKINTKTLPDFGHFSGEYIAEPVLGHFKQGVFMTCDQLQSSSVAEFILAPEL